MELIGVHYLPHSYAIFDEMDWEGEIRSEHWLLPDGRGMLRTVYGADRIETIEFSLDNSRVERDDDFRGYITERY